MDYLSEEFRAYPAVRVRRSRQGGGEEAEEGISVKTESREYFFPLEWAQRMRFPLVAELVARIKSVL
jgi:hypothetical protein